VFSPSTDGAFPIGEHAARVPFARPARTPETIFQKRRRVAGPLARAVRRLADGLHLAERAATRDARKLCAQRSPYKNR